jgi:hypothetical protein
LLAVLRSMFTKNRTEIASEQVVQELVADPDSPWHEHRGRGPITKNQVAALLQDYDIRPVVDHPTKRADFSRHGYRAAQFEDAFARFLPHEPNIARLLCMGLFFKNPMILPPPYVWVALLINRTGHAGSLMKH